MSESEKDRDKRFWVVDPAIYNSQNKRSWKDRLHDVLVPFGRTVLLLSLFAYPGIIVYVGVVYGAVAFWGFLLASFLGLGLLLWKTGYAKHFESYDVNIGRQLLGLVFGFLIVLGVYEGLFHLGFWVLAIVAGGGIAVLVVLVNRE